jgi:hypothetical protein
LEAALFHSALYREPVPLDSKLHRHKKLAVPKDLHATRNMHAVFIAAGEFPQACLEFPIVFVDTGQKLDSGKPLVSPVALLGVAANENLRLTPEGRWDTRYVPAFIRRFPFLTAGVEGVQAPGVFIDAAWSGFNDTQGEALFGDDGTPTPFLKEAIDFLQRFDAEQRRTRDFCARVAELDLLREMEADADLPGGGTIHIDGFMIVDEDKLGRLPEHELAGLHRSGMLMLMHAQLLSMGNMGPLMERKARMMMATSAAAAPGDASASAASANAARH